MNPGLCAQTLSTNDKTNKRNKHEHDIRHEGLTVKKEN